METMDVRIANFQLLRRRSAKGRIQAISGLQRNLACGRHSGGLSEWRLPTPWQPFNAGTINVRFVS
jgi:hypothetical protein